MFKIQKQLTFNIPKSIKFIIFYKIGEDFHHHLKQ